MTEQQKIKEDLLLINAYYTRCWKALMNKDYKLVQKILHQEMNSYLYDLSLTILNDRHPIKRDEELFNLITKVDVELENYYSTDKEEEELINDDAYVASIFNKRKYKKI